MIPFLSLQSLSSLNTPYNYPSTSTLPQSFLFECLKSSELHNNQMHTPDISILSADCLNSQNSTMRNRINILYQDAARIIINMSNKSLKYQCLTQWKKKLKSKQSDAELKRLTTGIVKLAYFMNKKLRKITLPIFINIHSVSRSKKSNKKQVNKLVETLEIVYNKYYKYQHLRDGFDKLKKESADLNNNNVMKNKIKMLAKLFEDSIKKSKSQFMQMIKENSTKVQKTQLFVESLSYIIKKCNQEIVEQCFKDIKLNKGEIKSKEVSTKSSAVQFSNKLTMSSGFYTNQFKRSTDSLPKYFDTISSSTKLTRSRHNNFKSEIKFSESRGFDVEQPEEADAIIEGGKGKFSIGKLSKGDLRFSSPMRSKSKGKPSIPSIPLLPLAISLTTCKPLIINYPFHRSLNLQSIPMMKPIEGNFTTQTKTNSLYHLQKDIVYTQVEDMIDNPQIFQLQQSSFKPITNSRVNNRFQTRTSFVSRSGKKSLQFKSKVGSPIHFKQIMSPKMFTEKSRENSQDKPKLGFNRPSTSKKSIRKTVEFNVPSSPKHEVFGLNRNTEGSTRKQIYKVRVQSPFVQEKSTIRKDLIFDSKAYFKQ